VCVTLAALALDAGRPFAAGLAIGALAYKPPLGIAAAVVLIASLEWTMVAGAVLSGVAQVAIGCLYWGFSILGPYAAALRRVPEVANAMEPFKYQMHSWRPFFQLLGLPESVALPAYALASAITLVIAVVAWRSPRSVQVRFGVLLLATMLVDPHLYVYDLMILMPGLLLLWDWAEGRADGWLRWGVRSLLAICYLAPLLGPLSNVIRVQSTVLVMSLLSVVATWPWLFVRHRESEVIH